MACLPCGKNTGMTDDLPRLLYENFEIVRRLFPNVSCICIINSSNGEIIASQIPDQAVTDFAATVSAVVDSAMKLVGALSLSGCKVLRLMGETRMFYCYEIESDMFCLAFYTSIDHTYPSVDATRYVSNSNSCDTSVASTSSQATLDRRSRKDGKKGRSHRVSERSRDRQVIHMTQNQIIARDAKVWAIIDSLRLLLVGASAKASGETTGTTS